MVHQEEISLSTDGHRHMQDLTARLAEVLSRSGVQTGILNAFNVGSTGALGAIEFEPGLERDLPEQLDRLLPPSRDYGHEQAWHDGNGHSHLQATLLGPSFTAPVRDGQLVLGDVAADRAPGMRCQTAAADRFGHHLRRSLSALVSSRSLPSVYCLLF